MKILITKDALIVLENVRKIERKFYTTDHTSRGIKYSIDHHYIIITYIDGKEEKIDCGEDSEGKQKANEIFIDIYKILSENRG